jgi:hypothetical protein
VKTVLLLVLLAALVAFYFGYEPSDLLPSFNSGPAAPPKARHTSNRPAEPAAPTSEPPRNTAIVIAGAPDGSADRRWSPYPNTTVVIAGASDGSLDRRWSPYPSASPTATIKH